MRRPSGDAALTPSDVVLLRYIISGEQLYILVASAAHQLEAIEVRDISAFRRFTYFANRERNRVTNC